MVITFKEHQVENNRHFCIYWLIAAQHLQRLCLCSKVTLNQSMGVYYKILPTFQYV